MKELVSLGIKFGLWAEDIVEPPRELGGRLDWSNVCEDCAVDWIGGRECGRVSGLELGRKGGWWR